MLLLLLARCSVVLGGMRCAIISLDVVAVLVQHGSEAAALLLPLQARGLVVSILWVVPPAATFCALSAFSSSRGPSAHELLFGSGAASGDAHARALRRPLSHLSPFDSFPTT